MIYEFPAVFYSDEKAIAFRFYDRADWFSFGENVDEAIVAAEEILSDALLDLERKGAPVPVPTPLEKVELKALQLVRMIRADTEKYARELARQNDWQTLLESENPIKELRIRRGLSVKDLAEILHAPYRTVQDWNVGKSKPPQWVLSLIVEKVTGASL